MKICIYGAGAIGGYMAVMLQRAGAEVSVIARGDHLKAMQARGLKLLVDGQELTASLTATQNPADLGPQDYVIVALKAHQAWESAEAFKPLLGRDTRTGPARSTALVERLASSWGYSRRESGNEVWALLRARS